MKRCLFAQGVSVSPELSTTRMQYLSTSLSRFDHVRRKQMMRLKKRSNWFLTASPGVTEREGSHDTSVAGSSDMLVSDNAMSDGAASDIADNTTDNTADDIADNTTDNVRIALDMDSTMNGNDNSVTTDVSVESSQRIQLHPSDMTDINHRLHRPLQRLSPSSGAWPTPSPSPPLPLSRVTDKEVRYFMVENYYGSPSLKKPS